MTLSPLDDYPVHQIPEVMRHVGTSDRNFYDRYYFNAFPLTGDTMLIVGLGQYPNLGVTDAFALLRRGSAHRVVRASRELGADRMNTRVGPFGVEVLEGLKRLRVVLSPNEHGLSFDLTWDGTIPPQEETIARYEEMLGRPMLDMGYYEVLSGFKFTVIMSRIAQAMIEWGLLDADSDFPFNNNASRLLDVILEGLPS